MVVNNKTISSIVLGCDHINELTPSIIDHYYNLGGRTLDSAHSYENSEVTLGKYFKENNTRKDFIVMSKGCRYSDPSSTYLRRMKEDYQSTVDQLGFEPDIWFLHRDCTIIPIKEILNCANEVLKNTVTKLGVSNFTPSRLKEALECEYPPICSQIQYSLAQSTPLLHEDLTIQCMNKENYDFYTESQLPIFAWSSQAKGFFSKLNLGLELSLKSQARFDTPVNRQRAKKVDILSKELNVSPASIVTSYIFSQRQIQAFPIIGSRTISQLEDSFGLFNTKLTEEQLKFLED